MWQCCPYKHTVYGVEIRKKVIFSDLEGGKKYIKASMGVKVCIIVITAWLQRALPDVACGMGMVYIDSVGN